MKIKFKLLVICFALVSTLFVSGCNTAKGFGKDVEAGGQNIQKASGR